MLSVRSGGFVLSVAEPKSVSISFEHPNSVERVCF
jgi:hypothetical protein